MIMRICTTDTIFQIKYIHPKEENLKTFVVGIVKRIHLFIPLLVAVNKAS